MAPIPPTEMFTPMGRAKSVFLLVFLLAALTATALAGRSAPHSGGDPAAPAKDPLQDGPHAGMLRMPDVSATHIVFSYANDLWLAPREGGMAIPLASPPGQELYPRFSRDGTTILFQGNYEGNRDLYTIPVSGGLATRLTHHPTQEIPQDWTPDGRILFMSGRGYSDYPKSSQLLTVDADGGMPQALPIPYGGVGAISDDGQWLAYTPYTRDHRTWKRYRGGMATDLWLFHLKNHSSEKITDWEGTDSVPMWKGQTLYYLSDAGSEHRLNIWKYDHRSRRHSQVTHFREYDVKTPSMGPGVGGRGEIVFTLGPELRILDLGSEESRVVKIRVPGDRTFLRPRTADASKHIQWWNISPSGKRAVVEARGDIWTLPAKKGSPRNLTRTDGVAERLPAWSPDGRWIAYFSDESGEYELYITQSDGKGETKRLTQTGGPYKTFVSWSPDSKHLSFQDKSGTLFLHTLESSETKEVDSSPFGFVGGGTSQPSWSHDSRWIAYSRSLEDTPVSAVFVHEVGTGTNTQLTSGTFSESAPVFDRKGDWMFYSSERVFSPSYSSVDTTFIYDATTSLIAVPLSADMESPWAPESDEESWDEEEEDTEEAQDAEEGEQAEEESGEESDGSDDENGDQEEAQDDGFSGTWEGEISSPDFAAAGMPTSFSATMEMWVDADGTLHGDLVVPFGTATILEGHYDRSSGKLTATLESDDGTIVEIDAQVNGESLSGNGEIPDQGMSFKFELNRTAAAGGQDGGDGKDGGSKSGKAKEVVEIDFEGFESRALVLPVKNGAFGARAVNDKNHLVYVRFPAGGQAGSPSIMSFDMEDEDQKEKTVAAGASNFEITPDGKKLLIVKGRSSAAIQSASSSGKSDSVPTDGMDVTINPQEEWRQIFTDAWRLQRDYFYDPNMHGVDWEKVHRQYMAMIDDCASREDVSYVLGEMIAEMNVGHAYITGGGDGESAPSRNVGMLGVDFVLNGGAYQIDRIYEGGPWDADARGPLSQPGIDVKEGDFLLAVNGIPLDTSQDPWAAFQGMANRAITLTVSEKSVLDEEARDVVVKPIGNEFNLRYRSWIHRNREYVAEKTGGRVGYVYVPDTGINGQNDLFRQFYGQIGKEALIIDERWNGGGQIPTRFIELLNRPAMNYWAGRDGKDWHWPPDSHQGPKCMLINGLAGSGGDLFPAYFQDAGIGKLIGMRTWGGLVGISGNPTLIDGGSVSVPTFAYYELDGTWGIEGHGVDPDIEVVDDPSLMVDGGDPQLDAAIQHMLEELDRRPYIAPKRPMYPNRSGMGIAEADK